MRFFLDHNVDGAVGRLLRRHRHEVWSASEAGRALESDDDLTVYADERHAVLLTHDKEFSQRRRRNVVGQHVWLRCDELDAPAVLGRWLPDLLPLLEGGADIWVEVSHGGVHVSREWK